ncbi:hypothetical protein AAY473_013162 [Plecturocebus cupreus]
MTDVADQAGCGPSLWEAKAGESQGQEFKTSLANMLMFTGKALCRRLGLEEEMKKKDKEGEEEKGKNGCRRQTHRVPPDPGPLLTGAHCLVCSLPLKGSTDTSIMSTCFGTVDDLHLIKDPGRWGPGPGFLLQQPETHLHAAEIEGAHIWSWEEV